MLTTHSSKHTIIKRFARFFLAFYFAKDVEVQDISLIYFLLVYESGGHYCRSFAARNFKLIKSAELSQFFFLGGGGGGGGVCIFFFFLEKVTAPVSQHFGNKIKLFTLVFCFDVW